MHILRGWVLLPLEGRLSDSVPNQPVPGRDWVGILQALPRRLHMSQLSSCAYILRGWLLHRQVPLIVLCKLRSYFNLYSSNVLPATIAQRRASKV